MPCHAFGLRDALAQIAMASDAVPELQASQCAQQASRVIRKHCAESSTADLLLQDYMHGLTIGFYGLGDDGRPLRLPISPGSDTAAAAWHAGMLHGTLIRDSVSAGMR